VHVFGRGQSATRQDLASAEFVESMDHFRQAATHAAGGLGATVGPKVGLGMDIARDKMGSARGYVGTARAYMVPGTAKMTQAASRGWDTTIAFVMPLADAARVGSIRAATLPDGIKLPSGVKVQAMKAQAIKAQAMRKKTPPSSSSGHTATAMVSIVAAGAALGATGALVARRRNRSKWAEYEPAALQDDAQAFVDQTRSSGRGGADGPRTASKMAGWAKEHSRWAMDGVRGKMHDSSATSAGSHMDEMTSRPGRMGDDMAEPMPGKASDATERAGDGAHHMADKADAKLNDATGRRGAKPSSKSTDASDAGDDTMPNAMPPNKNGRQQQ
jgi:hypothetical protein